MVVGDQVAAVPAEEIDLEARDVRAPADRRLAHETAGQGKRTVLVNGGHPVATRQCAELFAPRVEKYIRANYESAGFQSGQDCEGIIDLWFGARS